MGNDEPVRPRRWPIAVAATLMQGAVGATYAWSVFRDPLATQHGWTIPEVTLAYSLNLFGLGIFAFIGGIWMRRDGPRVVGLAGGLLYGLGLILAGLFGDQLSALYVGFGIVAGIGRGLGWVVPTAMVVAWFPDRRGFVSGLSVAGNGIGALIAAPLATGLIERVGVLPTFMLSGAALLVIMIAAALVMREPPEGYCPSGWSEIVTPAFRDAGGPFTVREALATPQWYALWGMLFIGSSAGLAILSHAAPMVQERTGVDAMAAAGVVGMLSAAGAVGRLCWAWLSDLVGRRAVFASLLLILAVSIRALPIATTVVGFVLLAGTATLCFGGGLSTMPALAADFFGSKHVGPIVGLLMTAQGCAAMLGPMLLAAPGAMSDSSAPALTGLAVALVASALLPVLIRPPVRRAGVGIPIRLGVPATR